MMKILIIIFSLSLFSSSLLAQTGTDRWRLIWDPNTEENMSYYRIYRDTHSSPTTQIDTTNHPHTEYIDTDLKRGVQYYYRLKAVDAEEDSSVFSEEVSASIPLIDIPDITIYKNQDPFIDNLDDNITDLDNIVTEISWDAPSTTNLNISIEDRVVTISRKDISWYDTETITFTATDPDGFFDVRSIEFTVINEIQTGPQIMFIPGQTVPEGSGFAPINLDNYVSDLDYDDSEISWSASATTNITVTITNHVAIITANNPEWNGSETVTFTAENPDGLTASYDVTFVVTPVNDPPVVTNIPNQTIEKNGSFTSIDLDDYVSDVDNTDEEILWTPSPSFDLTITITDRVATITPNDPEWSGHEIITFRAEDPQGLEGSDYVVFTITDDSSQNQFKITAFPVPFRTSMGATEITFTNLPIGGKLIIYDLLGYPVYETDINSTEHPWRTLNQHGKWVRSGVYLYVVKNEKGKKVKSDKVIIIR